MPQGFVLEHCLGQDALCKKKKKKKKKLRLQAAHRGGHQVQIVGVKQGRCLHTTKGWQVQVPAGGLQLCL